MYDESSQARKRTPRATSSAVPSRPSSTGWSCAARRSASSPIQPDSMGVSMGTGADGVHPDAEAGAVDRQRARHVDDAGLGRAVGHRVRRAQQSELGGGEDDGPASGIAKRRDALLGHAEMAGQIDRHAAHELLGARLFGGTVELRSSVAEDDVEAAERIDRGLDEGSHLRRCGDVGGHEPCGPARGHLSRRPPPGRSPRRYRRPRRRRPVRRRAAPRQRRCPRRRR